MAGIQSGAERSDRKSGADAAAATQQPSQNEEKQVGSSVRQPVEVSFFFEWVPRRQEAVPRPRGF